MPLTPQATDYLGYAYAILLGGGGLLGAVRRGSLISLIMGGGSGLVAGYGAYRNSLDNSDVKVSLGTTIFLTTIMTYRFYRTEKFMPAGLIMIISLIMLCRYAIMIA